MPRLYLGRLLAWTLILDVFHVDPSRFRRAQGVKDPALKDILKRVISGASGLKVLSLPLARPSDALPELDLPQYEATAAPDSIGFIDRIGAGTVEGWAASKTDLTKPARVRLYLDDILSAEGLADVLREDVKAAGYGDGRHGFRLIVPKKALFCAEFLALAVVDADGCETLCERRCLREAVKRKTPVLYMDASDLIEFLTHHRELSGIQRVQAGYLLGLGMATIAGTQCRICTRFKTSSFYYEVPYARFSALLRDAGDLSAVPEADWASHVRALKESLTVRATLAPGDTIFTMGAPWALDDHNETIRCAKLFYGARYLQIFYDLIPISVPEVVAAPLIPHFARAMSAMALYADHIYAISRYSQDDLAATLARIGRPVPPTSVIPMGGSITDSEGGGGAPVDIAETFGIAGPFVLCVGTLEPRKNHALLFQVWRRLVAEHGADAVPTLVLVGRVGWYMDDFMRILKVTGFVEKTIVHLQGVSNAALSTLYDVSLFTIFPSFSEGWGLPITESLARGKVCVCSNSTSMPEAGGPHALYIDPYDTTAAYDLCEALIYDGETLLRAETALRGSFHAPTWAEASDGLRAQFADLVPRLAALPKARRKAIEPGRTYKFYNIESASPDATSTDMFRNFLDQEDALDLLDGWAWFDLDVSCTWACGPTAALSLVLPDESTAVFVVYLDLVIPPAYAGIAFEILVDGSRCGRSAAGAGFLNASVEMPASLAQERKITFRMLDQRLPSADSRLLGLGIANVTLFALHDLKGRLAFTERQGIRRIGWT